MKSFLAIVRTESVRKATELLYLSQATVSYRLKTLEQEMGPLWLSEEKGHPKSV
ncbi:helix-turn-helix domain-containing protein [Paenibacillus periandrae]|uniref:helix-turn-helix domain-containing protein n=1 Tax=Paenibacillus periandrae TaxID=1761741 RepID=UPI001F08DBBE|nr:LysR family transcriptional regulator [Paenibacillus periandrae]